MPEMQADMYLPEYRVTLGAELFVTATCPLEAHARAVAEVSDALLADVREYTSESVHINMERLFTTVLVEKMEDPEDDDDDGDGDDDAPDDHPRKPKRPGRMGK